MISGKYLAYPEYKDSGEEWLGEIPSHWEAMQIKHLSPIKRGASPRPIDDAKYFDEEGEYAWTRIADVTASDVYLLEAPQRLSDLGSSLSVKLEPESLFLSIAGSVGKPCITGIRACIHDGFVYFPQLSIPSKFLFYVFAGEQAYKGLGKMGTQLNLNTDTVGGIKIGCTTNEELKNIVCFLDHETAKIDALIEKQQQLIELLKEKRQAVISHAVTKGLNSNIPTKPSSVEWLGDVPEHWEMLRGSWIGRLFGSEAIAEEDVKTSGSIPFIKVSSLALNGFNLSDLNFYLDDTTGKQFKTRSNYLVFPKRGAAIFTNKVNYVDVESIIDPILMGWEIGPKALPEFVAHLLKLRGLEDIADVSTVPQINNKHVEPMVFPIPPKEEQATILEYLASRTGQIDELILKASNAIDLMQERRTALISAAVTGKIDVRN